MIQELFHIGSFSVSPFGVMLVVAFVASYLQLSWGMRRLGAGNEEDASALIFAAGVGGIVGAKVYYAILYGNWRLLFDRSGLVWYGGFILGALGVLWVMRSRRLPAWETADAVAPALALGVLWVMRSRRLPAWATADAVAPALALGYAIGRIGCFLVGDDYGRPTTLPWGVAFPVGLPPTTAGALRETFHLPIPSNFPDDFLMHVHPTQVYETLICLAIWGIGVRYLRRGGPPGSVVLPVLALLAAERFAVEFLRAKDDRFLGSFTLAQAISIAVFLLVLGVWWSRRRVAVARAA